MRRHVGLFDLLVAANVRSIEMYTWNVRADGLHIPGCRQRIHIVPRQYLGVRYVFHVDRSHLSLDFDGLAHGSHLHFGVYRHGHVGWNFDLLFYGAEAGHCERHGISARTDIDDCVSSFTVGGGGARSFNQRWTGSFYRDARHDCSRAVPDLSRNCALRACDGCEQNENGEPDYYVPHGPGARHLLSPISTRCRPGTFESARSIYQAVLGVKPLPSVAPFLTHCVVRARAGTRRRSRDESELEDFQARNDLCCIMRVHQP